MKFLRQIRSPKIDCRMMLIMMKDKRYNVNDGVNHHHNFHDDCDDDDSDDGGADDDDGDGGDGSDGLQ